MHFICCYAKLNLINMKKRKTEVVSNSVCPKCKSKGHKTTLTENSYACKRCETWWANGC